MAVNRLQVSDRKEELDFEICCTEGHLYLAITCCVFHNNEANSNLVIIIHRKVDM